MISLIIASESEETMQHWVSVLEPKFSVSLFDSIETIFSGERQYDKDCLLILEASLISGPHQLIKLCQLLKKVIVIGENYTHRQQIQLVFDGARGYSDKYIDQKLIIRTVEAVLNDEIWLERQLIPKVLDSIVVKQYLSKNNDRLDKEIFKTLSVLTKREIEVIEHVYKGQDNQTISNTLHISIRTVKAHLTAIFRKLQVHDRFQLVVYLKNLHIGHLSNEKALDKMYHSD